MAADSVSSDRSPIVDTRDGPVRGVALDGRGAAFRGIPFAAPPVGPLRWREARASKPWPEIRDATRFGPACPQRTMPGEPPPPQSEDCLTLNVVTPDLAARDLPVLFSIHGGAFFVGSGRYIADRDLSPIVRRGVVLVSANYRIGRFGFLAHPALTAEAGRGTGNFWLSDQIAALDWVRRNISAFGGDPARVTILGCSAGGSSVNALMASARARGLFARGAAHSGGGFFNATRPLAVAEAGGVAFAERAGCASASPDTLDRLRSLDTAAILAADPGPPDFGAIVDGHFLAEPIAATFAAGNQAPVPLIVGSTSNEASIFGMMGFDRATMATRFGIDIEALRPTYEAEGALAEEELLRRVQTDFLFTTASFGLASFAARLAPTWSYHFAYMPERQRARRPGASHCADMSYIFNDDPRRTATDEAVAARQQDYWYNFIARGDPNGDGLPAWPRAEPFGIAPLLIDEEVRVAPDHSRGRISLWYERWRQENDGTVGP